MLDKIIVFLLGKQFYNIILISIIHYYNGGIIFKIIHSYDLFPLLPNTYLFKYSL